MPEKLSLGTAGEPCQVSCMLSYHGGPQASAKHECLLPQYGSLPELGLPILELPRIRNIVSMGLHWGPQICGNYRKEPCENFTNRSRAHMPKFWGSTFGAWGVSLQGPSVSKRTRCRTHVDAFHHASQHPLLSLCLRNSDFDVCTMIFQKT